MSAHESPQADLDTGYEIFIAALSVLSLVNIVLVSLLRCPATQKVIHVLECLVPQRQLRLELDQAAGGYHAVDQRRAIELCSGPRCLAGEARRRAHGPDRCWAGGRKVSDRWTSPYWTRPV